MEHHRGSTSTSLHYAYPLYFYSQAQTIKKANARAIMQSFTLPRRSLRKTAEEAQKQYESKCLFVNTLLNRFLSCFPSSNLHNTFFPQIANQETSKSSPTCCLKIIRIFPRLGSSERIQPVSSVRKWRGHGANHI